jgi:uncharacterized protein YkwD
MTLIARTLVKPAVLSAFALLVVMPGAAVAQESDADTAADGCANASAVPHTVSIAAVRNSTLCLLNIERERRGLRPLRQNRRLQRAAARHARDMDRRNYFDHDSRGGSTFVDRIKRARYLRGVRSWVVGENLAWGTSTLSTPRSIMRAWMKSPGHRSNILNAKFREIGIGISLGAPVAGLRNGATYATSFGARRG